MVLLSFIKGISAETPQWSVNPAAYNFSMSYVGFAVIENENAGGPNDLIAAFYGDECRGVATPVFNEDSGKWIFFMMLYSNVNGLELTFKYYRYIDEDFGDLIDLQTTVIFQADGLIGSALDPVATSDVDLPDADLISFQLPGQIDSEIAGDTVYVIIEPEINPSSLIAVFNTSPGSLVKVENTIQFSGVTPNDFSQIVHYTIRSGNRSLTRDYYVKLDFAQIEILASVFMDEVEINSPTDSLFAWINGSKKASSEAVWVPEIEKYRYKLTIPYHNAGGIISYQLYQSDTETTTDLSQESPFVAGNNIGTLFNPLVLSEPLLTGNSLNSFQLNGQYGPTLFTGNDLHIRMDMENRSFIPQFDVSPGAIAMVNDSVQYSNFTQQDYSEPVSYRIYSSDQSANQDYTVNVVDYKMEIVASVLIDQVETNHIADTLFAYIDGELSGKAVPWHLEGPDKYRFNLSIMNYSATGNISFSYYHAASDTVIELTDQIDFEPYTIRGTSFNPIMLSNNPPEAPRFTSFTVEGQYGSTLLTDDGIIIRLPESSQVESVMPVFETTSGTIVEVADSVQYSAFTAVSFSEPVTYTLFNYNRSASYTYTVELVQNYMDLTAAVIISGEPSSNAEDSLFAYADGYLAGAAKAYFVDEINQYRFDLRLLHYFNEGEVDFVWKSGENGETTELTDTEQFLHSASLGTVFNPVWLADEPQTDNEILSFNIDGQLFNTVIQGNEIIVRMPLDMETNNLTPIFEVSGNAIATINDSVQYSGFTSVDFTFPVPYRVFSYNRESYTDYLVKVVHYYADFVAAVFINGEEITAPGDTLFAFVDDKLSGIAEPLLVEELGRYRFPLTVISPMADEMISFKYKNGATGSLYNLIDMEPFEDATLKGTLYNPVVFTNELMTGNTFTSFAIPGQIHETRFDGTSVYIKLHPDNLYTDLAPAFETETGAIVMVSDSVHYSEITTLDLSEEVIYRVYSYNKSTYTDYTVSVDYNHMNITATVLINGKEEIAAGDSLMVYIDGRLSGAAVPFFLDDIGKYRFGTDIFHYFAEGDNLFRYKRASGQVYDLINNGYHFLNETSAGTSYNPIVLYDQEINDSRLETFTLAGQMGATVYDGEIIKIIYEPGTDVSSLEANFELTDGARLFIADSIQYPEFTANNYNMPVQLDIVNPDNTTSESYTVEIIFADYSKLEASGIISPNGDMVNDTWYVKEVEKYRESEFTIFDAHGRIVHESIGYDNQWNGYINNELLPIGSYYYTIKSPDGKFVKGVLSLVY